MLLITISMLLVVVVGMLIMTQAVSLEQIGDNLWKGFVSLAIVLIGTWVFRVLMLPILVCLLLWLKHAMAAALFILLVLVALMLLFQSTTRSIKDHRVPERSNKEE